jgi:hypothetical protein
MATTGTKQAWARGGTIFAATLLLLIGVFQFFLGIAAIVQNNFFVVTANYTYEINTTAWGWIHLGIGVLAVITGFFLFTAATWARVVAIAMAAISAIANFFFLPYYPLWSLLIIAVDIFAIWAIANVRRGDFEAVETQAAGSMGAYSSGAGMQSGQRWPENPSMQQPAATSTGMQTDTAQSGRHWAPENVKEGQPTGDQTQQQAQQAAQEAQQRGQGR